MLCNPLHIRKTLRNFVLNEVLQVILYGSHSPPNTRGLFFVDIQDLYPCFLWEEQSY